MSCQAADHQAIDGSWGAIASHLSHKTEYQIIEMIENIRNLFYDLINLNEYGFNLFLSDPKLGGLRGSYQGF